MQEHRLPDGANLAGEGISPGTMGDTSISGTGAHKSGENVLFAEMRQQSQE
jgi:hypothetical protein